MKMFFLLGSLIGGLFFQISYAQNSTQPSTLPDILSPYYHMKDALVEGNSNKVSSSSEQYLKTLNTIDYKVVSEGNVNALLKDASAISESKDIERQRESFVNLSNNMFALAKAVKLSSQPIYQVYCPMKKASWLSNDKEIRNPYYGSAMMGCGKVVETIQ